VKLKRQQIPNILTIFRILVTIVIATLFVLNTYLSSETIYQFKIIDIVYKFNTYYLCIAILTFLGMMSDFLDGYLARKFN
jgi:phosphatidylglycerophosphate synthase